MTDWDYERSRCWFPGSSEAAPADLPAEERPRLEEKTLARVDLSDAGHGRIYRRVATE
jgi:hypothetical protein